MRNQVLRFLAISGFFAFSSAHAQTMTTGSLKGTVTDRATNEPVAGAMVVATSAALQGNQTELTSDDGTYLLGNLPPGTYKVAVNYAGLQVAKANILVQLGKVARVNLELDTSVAQGEVITIVEAPPVIDMGSTKTGTSITPDYTRNVPTGLTFGTALGAAAGAQSDSYGTSFGGSTSVENTYIVDGINTTEVDFGRIGTNLPNEFIQEMELITGAYGAEFGRATGGVVNVLTKSGTNEFHGSLYGSIAPGALSPAERFFPREDSVLNYQYKLGNKMSLGAEIGGPIVKDKLWFYAAFNPVIETTAIHRRIDSFVDDNDDGVADVDAEGNLLRTELASPIVEDTRTTYYASGKLSFALSPYHQGVISVFGNPSSREGLQGPGGFWGGYDSIGIKQDSGAIDVSAKWTSSFADNKSQIDAVFGLHRQSNTINPLASSDLNVVNFGYQRPLSDFSALEDVPAQCVDGSADDAYANMTNCPVMWYQVGGPASDSSMDSERMSGRLAFTHRIRALGHHILKAGIDTELNSLASGRHWRGPGYHIDYGGYYLRFKWATIDTNGDIACGIDTDGDGVGDAMCSSLDDALTANTTTSNFGAYLNDSWQITPSLTFNAGLRWERQQLGTADELQGAVSGATGDEIGSTAFALNDLLAPRLGLIYDFTGQGRSRLFGHWGRFYESIPMDINNRSFGGEVYDISGHTADNCTGDPLSSGFSCGAQGNDWQGYFGGGTTLVAPGLKAQYLDEMVFGAEYEVLPELKLGLSFIRRDLGRVIEDVSTDGGTTYVIANPGEVDEDGIDEIRAKADEEEAAGNAEFAAILDARADMIEAAQDFDKPIRTYNALAVTATKRFSKSIMVLGSYVYSRARGNYPGLFSPDTGQLDPNITSMYDLPDLMANRYGDLPHDRPHQVKLDSYYRLPVKNAGDFTLGASVRAQSGRPHSVLGAHATYGANESYILPRGAGERSPFESRFDAHVAFARKISKSMELEAYMDVFNLLNQQEATRLDEAYTYSAVSPIVGGDAEDLEHVKDTTGAAIVKNTNYGNPIAVQSPRYFRFGLRLFF